MKILQDIEPRFNSKTKVKNEQMILFKLPYKAKHRWTIRVHQSIKRKLSWWVDSAKPQQNTATSASTVIVRLGHETSPRTALITLNRRINSGTPYKPLRRLLRAHLAMLRYKNITKGSLPQHHKEVQVSPSFPQLFANERPETTQRRGWQANSLTGSITEAKIDRVQILRKVHRT